MRLSPHRVRVTIIKISTNNKCWTGKREPSCAIGRNANWSIPCGEEYGVSFKKLKNRVTMWSSKLILQHISREKMIQNNTLTLIFTAALFRIVKTQEQAKFSLTDEWIKKVHIYTGVLLRHNIEKIMALQLRGWTWRFSY